MPPLLLCGLSHHRFTDVVRGVDRIRGLLGDLRDHTEAKCGGRNRGGF